MRTFVSTIVFTLLIAAMAVAGGQDYASTEKAGVEICFPRKAWDGPVSEDFRPCDILNRPEEDGSGRLYLGTLANDRASCLIPNPAEEHGTFYIKCHRVDPTR